jgi:hypothetical protein
LEIGSYNYRYCESGVVTSRPGLKHRIWQGKSANRRRRADSLIASHHSSGGERCSGQDPQRKGFLFWLFGGFEKDSRGSSLGVAVRPQAELASAFLALVRRGQFHEISHFDGRYFRHVLSCKVQLTKNLGKARPDGWSRQGSCGVASLQLKRIHCQLLG